jgi:putative solute:sodium symporter small subunit
MSDPHTEDGHGPDPAVDEQTASTAVTDGGETVTEDDAPATAESMSDVEREREIDYLDVEINLLRPATPFMRDHLKVIWIGALVWACTTFGPITLTRLAPDAMTSTMPVLGFPLHYFLIAIGSPSAALLLSVWYARKRDQIDRKYGIEQGVSGGATTAETAEESVAATDGGARE